MYSHEQHIAEMTNEIAKLKQQVFEMAKRDVDKHTQRKEGHTDDMTRLHSQSYSLKYLGELTQIQMDYLSDAIAHTQFPSVEYAVAAKELFEKIRSVHHQGQEDNESGFQSSRSTDDVVLDIGLGVETNDSEFMRELATTFEKESKHLLEAIENQEWNSLLEEKSKMYNDLYTERHKTYLAIERIKDLRKESQEDLNRLSQYYAEHAQTIFESIEQKFTLPPLLLAVLLNDVATVKKRLGALADPITNMVSKFMGIDAWMKSSKGIDEKYFGATLLHFAISDYRSGERFQAIRKRFAGPEADAQIAEIKQCEATLARYLITAGIKCDEVNAEGYTPLHVCAKYGNEVVADMLLKKGVNVNARGEFARTPLHFAVYNGHLAVAKRLLEVGADVNACSQDLGAPIHIAAERGLTDMMRLLIAYGAEVNAVFKRQGIERVVCKPFNQSSSESQEVQWNGRAIDWQRSDSDTPVTALDIVVEQGNAEAASLLITSKANIDGATGVCNLLGVKKESVMTPLVVATLKGDKKIAVELLLIYKAVYSNQSYYHPQQVCDLLKLFVDATNGQKAQQQTYTSLLAHILRNIVTPQRERELNRVLSAESEKILSETEEKLQALRQKVERQECQYWDFLFMRSIFQEDCTIKLREATYVRLKDFIKAHELLSQHYQVRLNLDPSLSDKVDIFKENLQEDEARLAARPQPSAIHKSHQGIIPSSSERLARTRELLIREGMKAPEDSAEPNSEGLQQHGFLPPPREGSEAATDMSSAQSNNNNAPGEASTVQTSRR